MLALPYIIWLIRADTLALPHWPDVADLGARALHWGWLLGGLLLAISGIIALVIFNSGWFTRNPEDAPIIFRPPVDLLARNFVYFFAIAPALAGSLISGLFNLDRVVGGAGIALLLSGLAAIVATGDLVQLRRQRVLRTIWAAAIVAPALAVVAATLLLAVDRNRRGGDVAAARAMGRFFDDSFVRRTSQAAPRRQRRCRNSRA
ncbi:MAG: hypothetical protein WDN50_18405 [Bradyrhizobium sp.]